MRSSRLPHLPLTTTQTAPKPAARPRVAHFSSGPCAKRPGYSLENLRGADLGRSHRSKPGKAKLKLAIDETRAVLGVPDDYLIGVVPASDTGAFEMAMWSMWALTERIGTPAHASSGGFEAMTLSFMQQGEKPEILEALKGPFAVLDRALVKTGWLVGGRFPGGDTFHELIAMVDVEDEDTDATILHVITNAG